MHIYETGTVHGNSKQKPAHVPEGSIHGDGAEGNVNSTGGQRGGLGLCYRDLHRHWRGLKYHIQSYYCKVSEKVWSHLISKELGEPHNGGANGYGV